MLEGAEQRKEARRASWNPPGLKEAGERLGCNAGETPTDRNHAKPWGSRGLRRSEASRILGRVPFGASWSFGGALGRALWNRGDAFRSLGD